MATKLEELEAAIDAARAAFYAADAAYDDACDAYGAELKKIQEETSND
jgi:hypothetical protein